MFSAAEHITALREAWREFKDGVEMQALDFSEHYDGSRRFPAPVAWLLAPWAPLAYRFRPLNLERILRPRKAARRERLWNLREYASVCGAGAWGAERWVEVEALLAEFGGDFPPRDYEPISVCDMVGGMMGLSREEVAEIVA